MAKSDAEAEAQGSALKRFLVRRRGPRWYLPRSSFGRTAVVVTIMVVVTQYLSIAFFSMNFYAPEIRQHAHVTATQIRLMQQSESEIGHAPWAAGWQRWLRETSGIYFVRSPEDFPNVREKPVAELFTRLYGGQLSEELGEPVEVYFEFKPTPSLWIYFPSLKDKWIREPIVFFAEYNRFIIIAWLFGVPLLTIIGTVLLVGQLNRPLKRLANAALHVAQGRPLHALPETRGPVEIDTANRAFNQMRSQLQQSARDRTFLLAAVSHDLRTPLTRMRLTAEMLPNNERELAEGMIMDIEDMDAILDQFIAFIRDGSDEPVTVCTLNEVAAEVVSQFASQGSVRWRAGNTASMAMHRLSIKRLISNLVSNALRYGGPEVTVSTGRDALAMWVSVADNGPGIAEEELERLLQPFTRGEKARTTKGTGLGLAIAERIAHQHHGELIFSNRAEGGLEVKVRFPVQAHLLYPRSARPLTETEEAPL